MITADRLRELLHYCPETGIFTWLISTNRRIKIGSVAGTLNSRGYICININGKIYKSHRLAWLYVHGNWPANNIDHIDGSRSNNAISNLRDVNQSINQQNRRIAKINNKSTGLLGVTKRNNQFLAQIMINGKSKYLGLFDDANVAHEAYLAAKRIHHKGCTI